LGWGREGRRDRAGLRRPLVQPLDAMPATVKGTPDSVSLRTARHENRPKKRKERVPISVPFERGGKNKVDCNR